jgi:hypothetical protein
MAEPADVRRIALALPRVDESTVRDYVEFRLATLA